MSKNKIIFICESCLSRNYTFNSRNNKTEKLVLNKYCPTCNKYTKHIETR